MIFKLLVGPHVTLEWQIFLHSIFYRLFTKSMPSKVTHYNSWISRQLNIRRKLKVASQRRFKMEPQLFQMKLQQAISWTSAAPNKLMKPIGVAANDP